MCSVDRILAISLKSAKASDSLRLQGCSQLVQSLYFLRERCSGFRGTLNEELTAKELQYSIVSAQCSGTDKAHFYIIGIGQLCCAQSSDLFCSVIAS